jgi:elongation factor Ts
MISANLVRDLREKTGAGMMDCKKALVETNGDFEAAVDWLRTKGLAAAAKKAGRVTAEGLVAVHVAGNLGAAIELNSETDFVARNELFQNLVDLVSKEAINHKDINSLLSANLPNGKTVEEEVKENVGTIGENLNLRRMGIASVNNGVIASYIHNSVVPNMGKISVLVALESTASDKSALEQLGKQIAMHVAAARPQALDSSGVDSALVERERSIFIEQSKASGKPDNIIEKMVEGRIRKFYEEIVLLDQVFVIDGKSRISEVLADASKKLGADVKINSFIRFELGEGIEVEESDFAAEVAATAGI